MRYPPKASDIEDQITIQMELAGLATINAIRSMHKDLEQLYRTQLAALVLDEALPRLGFSQPTAFARCHRTNALAICSSRLEPKSRWSEDQRLAASQIG